MGMAPGWFQSSYIREDFCWCCQVLEGKGIQVPRNKNEQNLSYSISVISLLAELCLDKDTYVITYKGSSSCAACRFWTKLSSVSFPTAGLLSCHWYLKILKRTLLKNQRLSVNKKPRLDGMLQFFKVFCILFCFCGYRHTYVYIEYTHV